MATRRARHKRENPKGSRRLSAERPIRSVTGARRVAWRATEQGAPLRIEGNLARSQWDIARDCQRPYVRHIFGSTHGRDATPVERKGPQTGVSVEMLTPCRRCEACLAARRRLWSARARSETAGSPETWFGTLTFRADLQFHWLQQCWEDARADGVDFDQLSIETQFSARLRRAAKEARKYIARLRQVLPCPIVGDKRVPNWRYLLVAERHSQGTDDTRPHFHMLLHVISPHYRVPLADAVTKYGTTVQCPQVLEDEWEACGFSKWRQVTSSNCTYLCKYLAKDSNNRVRASQMYGAFDYAGLNHLNVVNALASIASTETERREP